MSNICLLAIEFIDTDFLQFLRTEIENEILLSVEIGNAYFDPQFAFSPSRSQYHSTLILSRLLQFMPDQYQKVIGITSLDLFIPVLTFVFGEAQLNGRAAVVSSFRLHNEFYGMPQNKKLFKERHLKEGMHELGHTFGLIHCPDYNCVLHPSTYVGEIDLKTSHFCTICKNMLFQRIKNNDTLDLL